ncbi:hypothetical protein SAMN05216228_1021115 [Rhizobium tibeticum]|uniref:Uncharacterized protein n=1 Tax=Rhizobium tibeticum TaxID=501024 RepID=A0A1H8RHG4_9HYPH|nr:hypothetical protein RTCCBAU85039_4170 [Rhizobium tibeticum]SEO65845.1 hypothetical protein SAMN05216228_1021115 [Rhizobium tibeticum]
MPYSRDIVDSMTEVNYVTELNTGITAKLGIKHGDKVDECDDRADEPTDHTTFEIIGSANARYAEIAI